MPRPPLKEPRGTDRTVTVSKRTEALLATWAEKEHRSVNDLMRAIVEDVVEAGLLGQIHRSDLSCPHCGTRLMFDVLLRVRIKTEGVLKYGRDGAPHGEL